MHTHWYIYMYIPVTSQCLNSWSWSKEWLLSLLYDGSVLSDWYSCDWLRKNAIFFSCFLRCDFEAVSIWKRLILADEVHTKNKVNTTQNSESYVTYYNLWAEAIFFYYIDGSFLRLLLENILYFITLFHFSRCFKLCLLILQDDFFTCLCASIRLLSPLSISLLPSLDSASLCNDLWWAVVLLTFRIAGLSVLERCWSNEYDLQYVTLVESLDGLPNTSWFSNHFSCIRGIAWLLFEDWFTWNKID